MLSRTSLIDDLENAIASGSDEKRIETLRRVTDLFAHGAEQLSEEQVAVFDDVIGRLAEDIELVARAELAQRLAPIANAPTAVVRALARDDEIDVAGPILEGSARVSDADLIAAAKAKGQGHLLAISKREALSQEVTDVLVDRGNQEVVHSVAQNDGARFSDVGFIRLVKKSVGDDVLGEAIALRRDVPPQYLQAVLLKASEKVMKRLMAASSGTHPHLAEVIATITARIQAQSTPSARNYAAAKRTVDALIATGKLDDDAVAALAQADKFEEVAAALSTVCRLSISEVERALQDSDPGLILIIVRAAGLSWPTTRTILQMSACGHGSSQLDLDASQKNFERLQLPTARRVLRFYQVRQSAGKTSAGA